MQGTAIRPDDDLLTAQQTADLLTVHVNVVYKLVSSGALEYTRASPGKRGRLLFTRRQIAAYLNARRAS